MPASSVSHIRPDPKLLIIRRDNIGDLVLTTPLIHALRQRFPHGWIGALVNSYNARVLEDNPDVDKLFVYTKTKHRGQAGLWSAYWSTISLILQLRKLQIDYAILASPAASSKAQSFARWIGAHTVVGFGERANPQFRLEPSPKGSVHEVEQVFRIARLFGIESSPSETAVFVSESDSQAARSRITKGVPVGRTLIAIHISARKPKQRWPAERFVHFLRQLADTRSDLTFVLFWSPGAPDNPTHPGDDAMARQILDRLEGVSIVAFPTPSLSDLIAGLSVCDQIICSDGGAMHLAAALGKPILCFFGNSDPATWHPWKVPYILIQPESQNVEDISVEHVSEMFAELQSRIATARH